MEPKRVSVLGGVLAIMSAGMSAPARADEPFEVIRDGRVRVYEVRVHPDQAVTLYFPETVVDARYSLRAGYEVKRSGQALIVMAAGAPNPVMTIDVECETVRVAVLVRLVAAREDAHVVAVFHDLDAAEVFERRVQAAVERRAAPIIARYQELAAELEQEIARRGRLRQTRAVSRGYGVTRVKRIARTDGHAVIRLRAIIWLGSDAYFEFEIQNRGPRTYRLERISLRAAGREWPGVVAFSRAGDARREGRVTSGQRERGVVSFADAARWLGEEVSLMVVGGAGEPEQIELRVRLEEP